MKLLYITSVRIPHSRAHSTQVMMTCDALARAGAEVTLVAPWRRGAGETRAFTYFNLRPRFRIRYLPAIALPYAFPFSAALLTLSFALCARLYLLVARYDVLYTRGEMALFLPPARLAWESHIKPVHMTRYLPIFRHALLTIVVTNAYRKELIEQYHMSPDTICLAPDGVTLERFTHMPSKEDARRELGLPERKQIALYAGSNVAWKDVDTLVRAADLLPTDYNVILLGPFTTHAHVLTPGQVTPAVVPHWLAAADVLVATGAKNSDVADRYTSPLKIFEYLAAGRPIVAADTQSHHEILESIAYFYVPGSAESLAKAIINAAERDPDPALLLRTKTHVAQFSWDTRGKHILSALQGRGIM